MDKLMKKLKSYSILTVDGSKYYMSDFHKTTVSKRLVEKLMNEKKIEPNRIAAQWFEYGYKLIN